jgi:hypothetical protein
MAVSVYSYTIYHSPNAYLGTVLLRRAVAGLPGVELVRRPICVPHERGLMIAELLGGKENQNAGSYNREDCRRCSRARVSSTTAPRREGRARPAAIRRPMVRHLQHRRGPHGNGGPGAGDPFR